MSWHQHTQHIQWDSVPPRKQKAHLEETLKRICWEVWSRLRKHTERLTGGVWIHTQKGVHLKWWCVWYVHYTAVKLFWKTWESCWSLRGPALSRKSLTSLNLMGQEEGTVLTEPVWDKDHEERSPARAAVVDGFIRCPNSSSEAETEMFMEGCSAAFLFSCPSILYSCWPNSAQVRRQGNTQWWCLHTSQP